MYPNGSTPQGVLDMAGNVWEWCLNKYDDSKDIRIDRSGGRRVFRGGSWCGSPLTLRSAARSWNNPVYRFDNVGFRLAQDY
jgi:formylglycine-generating enzyme required for sulfatase activity